MKKVEVYSIGICSASACVEKGVSVKDIEAEVNSQHPTGIRSKWEISKDKFFADGVHTNPCQCQDHKNRQHYLLEC